MASLSSSYLFDPPSVTAINRGLVNSNAFDPAPSLFSSNVNPASINPRALPEPLNSVQAAIPFIPGLKMSGGSKRKRSRIHKKRINNISSMYKMKGSRKTIRRRIRQVKSKLRSRFGMKSRKNHKRSNRYASKGCSQFAMTGGYSQYLNNVPYTPNMSTGGPLPASLSALANPVPYQRIFNSDGLDNLNHFKLNSFGNSGSGMGFLSRGSY
jgi:hypothetical protein